MNRGSALTKKLILFLALVPLLLTPVAFPKSKSSASSGKKTIKVREYTRKDGTVVPSHARSASGQASGKATAPSKSKNPKVYCASCERDSRGKIRRSETATRAFRKNHPCPATRKTAGACPGYVIDHVVPLKRGGADDPRNMQWQTTAEAKAKDRVED
jgi:hypothetical protein